MRRADLAAIDAVLKPSVTWRGLPVDAVCHDRPEVLDMLQAHELHEGPRVIDPLELVAGDDAVVLGVRSPELDAIGDVQLDGRLFNVFTVHDERIASIQDYATRAEAIRAAGAADPAWR